MACEIAANMANFGLLFSILIEFSWVNSWAALFLCTFRLFISAFDILFNFEDILFQFVRLLDVLILMIKKNKSIQMVEKNGAYLHYLNRWVAPIEIAIAVFDQSLLWKWCKSNSHLVFFFLCMEHIGYSVLVMCSYLYNFCFFFAKTFDPIFWINIETFACIHN